MNMCELRHSASDAGPPALESTPEVPSTLLLGRIGG
jgi:hypothetical protein